MANKKIIPVYIKHLFDQDKINIDDNSGSEPLIYISTTTTDDLKFLEDIFGVPLNRTDDNQIIFSQNLKMISYQDYKYDTDNEDKVFIDKKITKDKTIEILTYLHNIKYPIYDVFETPIIWKY